MPRRSGSLRTGIIFKLLDSYLFALSSRDFQGAGTHLNSLARFLEIDIPPVPLNRIIYSADAFEWQNYCYRHEPKVLVAVNKNLRDWSDKNKPLRLWKGGDPMDDAGEEDEE
jgi:hypothetical protein